MGLKSSDTFLHWVTYDWGGLGGCMRIFWNHLLAVSSSLHPQVRAVQHDVPVHQPDPEKPFREPGLMFRSCMQCQVPGCVGR